MLDKPSKNSPRDNLQNHLKACQAPLKSYLIKATFLTVIFVSLIGHFFSQVPLSLRGIGFIVLGLLILLALGFSSHRTDLYRDLQLSIVQYQHDKIDFFKTYGDKQEDVIDDIRLIYETDNTVTVQFIYQGQPSQFSLSKRDLPQSYANQQLVVIARCQMIVKEHLAAYLPLFETRDLAQEYQTILKRPRVTDGFLSENDILQLSEAPDKPIVSFQLALITQPKESETSK
ncbi:hypothetical protein ABNG39_10330 [Streptococcus dysgalactiae]|uniref:Uncharacterized protein n=1 Tax=Streptococcus iniae TaxID=1346 RepID=A0A3L8GKQ7_STRIN|nr:MULTISPECIES: hypothetical protein [Streptococcus]RLU58482.1 hypothetical protein DIY07_02005 [Streptococcus iniae]WCE87024.1 hypothetical protein PMN45_05410 [Streptococcus dysgalactiae]WCN27020.1 hypothetical protein PP188_05420 [Streptococcus dysgalactiae]